MKKKKPAHLCVIPHNASLFSGVPEAIFASYLRHPKVRKNDSAFARDFILLAVKEAAQCRSPSVSVRSGAQAFMISIHRALEEWAGDDRSTIANLHQYWRRTFQSVLKSVVLQSYDVL